MSFTGSPSTFHNASLSVPVFLTLTLWAWSLLGCTWILGSSLLEWIPVFAGFARTVSLLIGIDEQLVQPKLQAVSERNNPCFRPKHECSSGPGTLAHQHVRFWRKTLLVFDSTDTRPSDQTLITDGTATALFRTYSIVSNAVWKLLLTTSVVTFYIFSTYPKSSRLRTWSLNRVHVRGHTYRLLDISSSNLAILLSLSSHHHDTSIHKVTEKACRPLNHGQTFLPPWLENSQINSKKNFEVVASGRNSLCKYHLQLSRCT